MSIRVISGASDPNFVPEAEIPRGALVPTTDYEKKWETFYRTGVWENTGRGSINGIGRIGQTGELSFGGILIGAFLIILMLGVVFGSKDRIDK